MEPFFAKVGHNAICYDISNIKMTVMMVAGNSYVENNFARAIVHCLTLVRILLGLDGLMHFFKLRCSFFISCGYLILAMCFISETRTSEYGNIAAIR